MLYQVHRNRVAADQGGSIFKYAMDICQQLVWNGLVHCDLNVFNPLVYLSGGAHSNGKYDGDFYLRHSGSSVTVVN